MEILYVNRYAIESNCGLRFWDYLIGLTWYLLPFYGDGIWEGGDPNFLSLGLGSNGGYGPGHRAMVSKVPGWGLDWKLPSRNQGAETKDPSLNSGLGLNSFISQGSNPYPAT